jgi:DNA-binding IclR family transcriptional regulator
MKRSQAAASRAPAPQSVERIFAILDHLAVERAGDSLAGIARMADAPKTSMVGLLAGMLDGGYLSRDEEGRYTLGPRMLSLAMRVTARTDVTALARPLLNDLVQQTGETALLGAIAPDAEVSIYIDKVESSSPVRYTVSLGERRELYATAIGKLLLAHMDKARQDKYLRDHQLRAFTANTITSMRRLRTELEEIVREGISRTDSERVVGASALAVPVLGPEGRLLLGIVLAGPSERMRDNRAHLERHLHEARRRLTELVLGRDSVSPR